MKKKLFFAISVVLCAVIGVCSFAGCSKPSAADEFNALSKKVISVMQDNEINIPDVKVDGSVKSGNTITNLSAEYVSIDSVDKIKEIVLKDSAVVSDIQSVDSARQEMYEQALMMTLIVGDGMVNNHNADTIYNTSVLVDCWWTTYMEFKTSGNLTTINTYSPASKDDCVYAGAVYLDYESKNNYNFVMVVIWEDGRMGYRYGNEKKQFIYLDYDPQNKYSQIYFSSKVGEGYISRDAQVVKNSFDTIKSQFDGVSVKDYEYLTEQKYTIDEEEWLSLCEKYFSNEVE